MITLAAIRELAKDLFPDTNADLVHLLYAWAIRDPEDELSALFRGSGLEADQIPEALDPLLHVQSDEDKDLLMFCIINVKEGPVTGCHLLRSLCNAPHRITKALVEKGLNIERLHQQLENQVRPVAGVLARHGIKVDVESSPILKYGRDLTALAGEGTFDDLCERPAEIDRLLEVLLRKRKGNPILTGSAGVGKTALVELLARMLAAGTVPSVMPGTRLFEISLGKLVAGTKYRGEFEERMDKVMNAVCACQPVILFFDEIHLLWGAGRAEGAPMDAANMLKPVLSRGEMRVVGATTVTEYNRYIARDEALARRFQEIRLSEPDADLSYRMVRMQADALADYHAITITDLMVEQAIELTNRHIPNRWQPDKSVDLLDSASVMARRKESQELTVADLLETLSRHTGRPLAALTGDDRSALRELSAALKKRVIGQDTAIEKVAATLIQHRQDLGPPERNLGTFLFAGDTGIGKTELARSIADVFSGSEKALLHLDMAEYVNLGSTNKLIGSPLGYVGSEEEGALIAWLHSHGSGVLLFDEIEKAHPEIHRLLLGLLDEGRIHSARGETMDTRQCVVILTTNAITAADMDKMPLGFQQAKDERDPAELLSDHFPREFLGRLDDIILFNKLGPAQMRRVMKLRLEEALTRLRGKGICVMFDEVRLLDYLMERLGRLKSGARGITRLLEQQLLQPISMAMLTCNGEGTIKVELDNRFYESGIVKIMSSSD